MNNNERMTRLCRTMHYLEDKPGFGLGWDTNLIFPFDGDADDPQPEEHDFPAWAHSSAGREAVRFVRHVWNPSHQPPSLVYWDQRHRDGYLAWAQNPWWC